MADRATVVLEGKCTTEQAEALRLRLLALIHGGSTAMEIRTEAVEGMDLAYLQVLVACGLTLERAGGRMELPNPSDPVKDLLEESGLRLPGQSW